MREHFQWFPLFYLDRIILSYYGPIDESLWPDFIVLFWQATMLFVLLIYNQHLCCFSCDLLFQDDVDINKEPWFHGVLPRTEVVRYVRSFNFFHYDPHIFHSLHLFPCINFATLCWKKLKNRELTLFSKAEGLNITRKTHGLGSNVESTLPSYFTLVIFTWKPFLTSIGKKHLFEEIVGC